MIILDCQFILIAEIPIAECPIAKIPIADCPIAEIPIAECLIAEIPIAECPIAEIPIAECPIAECPIAQLQSTPDNSFFLLEKTAPSKVSIETVWSRIFSPLNVKKGLTYLQNIFKIEYD